MVIRTPDEIDFSTFPESDGEPMAETSANALQMVDLQWALQSLFAQQGRVRTTTVGGNQMMYYNEHNGWEHISPDVYVIFDRPPPAPPSWKTWIEGKFPDIVFEISSSSTQDQDFSEAPRGKRTLYARLGAQEYYIYDPQQEIERPFVGFASRDGRMEPLPLAPGGGIMSPLLRTELRPVARAQTERRPAGVWLRVIDPTTGEPIPIAEDEHDDLLMAQERLTEEAQARLAAEQARLAAEERAVQAEAALQALLADMARDRGADT